MAKSSKATKPLKMIWALTASTAILCGFSAHTAEAQQAAQQQSRFSPLIRVSPERADYPTNIVAKEVFHFFKDGKVLPFSGNAAALAAWLSSPETAVRELGLTLLPGLAIQAGTSARVLEAKPGPRADVRIIGMMPSVPKVITLHTITYRGVPLAVGSDILSIATTSGRLIAVRERNLPQTVDGIEATVALSEAMRVATEVSRARGMLPDGQPRESKLEIFVDSFANGRLAWKITVTNESLTNPWGRDMWVAARGGPIVLADRERIYHTHHGHVTGSAWSDSPLGASPMTNIAAAFIMREINNVFDIRATDSDGNYIFPTGGGSASLSVSVSGRHSIVDNMAGAEISATGTGSPSAPIDLTLNAATEAELAQTSAYIWTTRAHGLVESILSPTALVRFPTRVNIGMTCNAFFNGNSINFFQAGSGCVNTAYSDVVFHEYGHAVDHALGGILNGGYSEGFGDALAIIGTRQPCVGRDFFGSGTCIRMATDILTWPPSSTEVHDIGRRYAGFAQELISQLQPIYGAGAVDVSRDLILGAAAANPADIPDAVRVSFIVDSGGDLGTCSPHFWFLAVAADSRRIPRPPDCASLWLAGFGFDSGWRIDKHLRLLADITGDEKADMVAFGDAGVWVATSNGATFDAPGFVLANFGYNAGSWRVDKHPRYVTDVTGDGRGDIVAFGDDGVWVANSNGSAFDPPRFVLAGFGYNAGSWRLDRHLRLLVDAVGDKHPDIVAFGEDGVWVAAGNGLGFDPPRFVLAAFAPNAGAWQVDKHVRLLGDITGDEKADIVAFGDDGVWIATSNGSGFNAPQFVIANFGYNAGAWRVDRHPRLLADINGDRKADIVAFGDDGVWIATSNGSGFNAPQFVLADFGFNAGGWRVDQNPRFLSDINNDGNADIIGFANDGVWVALSNGAGFSAPVPAASNFGLNAGVWQSNKHVRLVADVTGDHRADIVGFGDQGVWVSDLLPSLF